MVANRKDRKGHNWRREKKGGKADRNFSKKKLLKKSWYRFEIIKKIRTRNSNEEVSLVDTDILKRAWVKSTIYTMFQLIYMTSDFFAQIINTKVYCGHIKFITNYFIFALQVVPEERSCAQNLARLKPYIEIPISTTSSIFPNMIAQLWNFFTYRHLHARKKARFRYQYVEQSIRIWFCTCRVLSATCAARVKSRTEWTSETKN